MQKKLEAELMSIAHSILQMKNRDDLKALKQKSYETYEKLAILSYIQDFVRETPQNTKTEAELIEETFSKPIEHKQKVSEVLKEDFEKITVVEEKSELIEDVVEEIEIQKEEEKKQATDLQSSLKKEFEDTVSLDVATNMFENATRITPKKSLNDVVMQQKNLQIDLNDRIAFVKHLFNSNQEDFNSVISQLNTMSSEKEALYFLKMIKKEYHWEGKEIYENRLILLIERKFN